MGCESSQLGNQLVIGRTQSMSSEGELDLDFHKFIERQRGDVLQLYHFSKVISRSSTIVIKVLERNSRISRICKILTVNKRVNLFRSFQQVQILKNLNHPNIVQIIQYFNQHNFLYIILEDIPGKTLHQLYYDQELRCLQVIIQIVKQILIALKFCHQKGYAHKTINPQNIMIVKLQRKNTFLVKLIGFGHSLKIGAPKLQNAIISKDPLFTAPQDDNGQYADKQDIWATGIIFLQLISGERKFSDFLQKKTEIIQQVIEKLNLQKSFKTIIIDFLNRMLQISPQKRISANDALNHSIFQINHHKSIYLKTQADVMQKLMHFRVQNNLKSLFSIYASLNILSVVQKSQHLLEFYNLDKNKDGKIDFDELVEGMQNTFGMDLNKATESVNKIFSQANKNRQNYIQFHQYVMATTFVSKQVYENSLIKIFQELDINKDGQISQQQLNRSIEGINSSFLLKDHKNKSITFEEFRELMLSIFQEQKKCMEQQ